MATNGINPISPPTALIHSTPPFTFHSGVTVEARTGEPASFDPDAELLDAAHIRFQLVNNQESEWRRQVEKELQFWQCAKHWDEAQLRERAGRPSLTFDLIGPAIDQVVNDARQNPPEPRVSPVGSGADKDTANLIQGLIRNIDNDSRGDIAYMTGYEFAVGIGRGWWRVHYEYENDFDFKQKILIKRIANPFTVYPDPAASEFDYSDMAFCFVTDDMDEEVFKSKYPHSKAASGDFSGVGDTIKNDWFPKGCIRIAEYWWVETTEQHLCQLPDGTVVPWNEVPDGVIPVNTRTVDKRQVKVALLTGNEVLEQHDHPGKWIPIVPCIGREMIRDRKREYRGMVRFAMDANLSYDYMRSKQVEAVALTPLAPWSVYEGQIDGYETVYADANRKATAYLVHKLKDAEGNTFPSPPARITVSPDIQAITVGVQYAKQDCESQLATYAPSLGAPSPEASGRAITARQRESDNAHFNYHDNLARSIRHTGRIIVDLIPKIYSEERVVSIFDPDGTVKLTPINQAHMVQGVQKIFDLRSSAARYDVVIGSGPSYATKRQQGVDAFLQMVQAAPQEMAPVFDLGIGMMDFPNADKFAERLRPPNVQAQQDDEAPLPPQAMQIIQQQGQMIQAQTSALHKLSEIIERKILDHASAERKTAEQVRGQIIVAEINAKSSDAQALADNEMAGIKHRLDLLHDGISLEQEAQRIEMEQQALDQQAQQAAQPPAGGQPPSGGGQ